MACANRFMATYFRNELDSTCPCADPESFVFLEGIGSKQISLQAGILHFKDSACNYEHFSKKEILFRSFVKAELS